MWMLTGRRRPCATGIAFRVSATLAVLCNVGAELSLQQPRRTAAEGCPCLTEFTAAWATMWVANSTCQLLDGPSYTGLADEPDYCYPVDYGLGSCQVWDELLAPFCRNRDWSVRFDAPSWCTDAWCFVDQENCVLGGDADLSPSARQIGAGQELMYSYATCGLASNYAKFRHAALMSAAEIVVIVEQYVAEVRDYVELQSSVLKESEGEKSTCEFLDSCFCTECTAGKGGWQSKTGGVGYEITFEDISVVHRGDTTKETPAEQDAQCLARLLESKFKKIMRREYDDPTRMGFLYYGDQASAIAFWLPGTQWCTSPTSTYDPRFRPWYVSAVSGPKDVILVLDQSNSMRQPADNPRWNILVEAAIQVLNTLNEFDYVTIVAFHSVALVYDDSLYMIPATKVNIDSVLEWLGSLPPIGATNFRKAFDKAFAVADASIRAGHTTDCNRIMLFLTDGKDGEVTREGSKLKASEVAEMNTFDFKIFTYSFGDDADLAAPKEIACANEGIWYHLPDGGNVGHAMSNYYQYFAGALSDVKQIRWTPYKDITTGNELIAGCLPAFERQGAGTGARDTHLLGVACMDVSIVLSNTEFREKADYEQAMGTVQAHSQKCYRVRHSEEDLEFLRSEVAADSVCSFTSTTQGPANAATACSPPSFSNFFLLYCLGIVFV